MKRVLITGKGSYIGTKVKEWLEKYPDKYQVEELDLLDKSWREFDFSKYDVLYHVAGIVHRKNVPDSLYEEVNYKLAVEVAMIAQVSGVSQFIFMSSGAVYSQNDRYHRSIIVDEASDTIPVTSYGISKKRAEEDLFSFSNKGMKIAILRPPLVYGPGAKGNYEKLRRIALKTKFFPYINNKRSMIYIDNLCEFIRLLIDSGDKGIFLPQNKEYVNTSKLVMKIRESHGLKTYLIKGFEWPIYLIGKVYDPVNKAFGTFYYRKNNDYYQGKYQIVRFADSIRKTEEA